MKDFATALALVLVIEGMLYSLFPEGMKRMVAQMMALPPGTLRVSGLIAACLGVAAIWPAFACFSGSGWFTAAISRKIGHPRSACPRECIRESIHCSSDRSFGAAPLARRHGTGRGCSVVAACRCCHRQAGARQLCRSCREAPACRGQRLDHADDQERQG